jgi:hypothetical protein
MLMGTTDKTWLLGKFVISSQAVGTTNNSNVVTWAGADVFNAADTYHGRGHSVVALLNYVSDAGTAPWAAARVIEVLSVYQLVPGASQGSFTPACPLPPSEQTNYAILASAVSFRVLAIGPYMEAAFIRPLVSGSQHWGYNQSLESGVYAKPALTNYWSEHTVPADSWWKPDNNTQNSLNTRSGNLLPWLSNELGTVANTTGVRAFVAVFSMNTQVPL